MISLTYAGAGGGKTTSMVDSVCRKIPYLNSNRFLCVITYTNDSARDIKERLSNKIDVPNNVFIGTIHSFIYRFVIKPHMDEGANFSIVSELASKHEVMVDLIKWAKGKIDDPRKRGYVVNAKWEIKKAEMYKRLLESQLMTYDQLVKISKDLVSKSKIRKAISSKLQYLFIDEYQDTYKWQHDIFLKIYSAKRTELFIVGDPNQSIYGFAYGASENNAVKPKKYEDFPICQVKNSCDSYTEKTVNYRSSEEIVNLANTFNQAFQQTSAKGCFTPVRAIESSCSQDIYDSFNATREALGLVGTVFYLSMNKSNLLPYEAKIDSYSGSVCIRFIEASVSQCIGMSIKKLCEANMISRIQFRTLSVLVGKEECIDLTAVKRVFLSKFGRDLYYLKQELGNITPSTVNTVDGNRALTIHKSKGLEAESVLLILNSNNHLNKLLKKKSLMKSTTDDDLRLGYVALTRAEKLLVIACKETISPSNRIALEKLDVAFL
ncbi:DEAD/DEAH box helicase [Neptunomonas japonica]|uniref:DEAD/DEAH box helicase n=1 Tax=Neptunomonas japonica TaxID=417574 RepID=UPI0004223C6B|nr:DEAD/DEAH box helicase [Neptunomonas japonica]